LSAPRLAAVRFPTIMAYLSYGHILARKLHAECHLNGISGLAVRNGTGFYENGRLGWESTWKMSGVCQQYESEWDFGSWTPHVVIVALGANDGAGIGDAEYHRANHCRVLDPLSSYLRGFSARELLIWSSRNEEHELLTGPNR